MTYMSQAKADRPHPVTSEENQSVHGLALCHDDLFREIVARAEELRRRNAAYRDSLPRDPHEAIAEALKELDAVTAGWPSDVDQVCHSLDALRAFVGEGEGTDAASRQGSAADFLFSIAADAAQRLKDRLARIEDILCAPRVRSTQKADGDAMLHTFYRDWKRLNDMIALETVPEGSDEMRAITRDMKQIEDEISGIIPKTPRGWAERVALAADMGLMYEPEEPIAAVFDSLFAAAKEALADLH